MIEMNIQKQRATAKAAVRELTGRHLRHLRSGRPLIGKAADISVTHRDSVIGVGLVPAPYRIGIDIEQIAPDIQSDLFVGPCMSAAEVSAAASFCSAHGLDAVSGVAVIWSLKEAFFKCLDHDLKPRKIMVRSISKKGRVVLRISDEIAQVMQERKFKIHFAQVSVRKGYIFSQVVMVGISDKKTTFKKKIVLVQSR